MLLLALKDLDDVIEMEPPSDELESMSWIRQDKKPKPALDSLTLTRCWKTYKTVLQLSRCGKLSLTF